MKQLVKSTCVNAVWIMQMVQICISPVRCYELELNSRVWPALQTGWPKEQNKSGWRLLHVPAFIMLHSLAVMCLDACQDHCCWDGGGWETYLVLLDQHNFDFIDWVDCRGHLNSHITQRKACSSLHFLLYVYINITLFLNNNIFKVYV